MEAIKLTVNLGDRDLYRSLRHAAIERDRTVREIVVEALREWLDRQEAERDLSAIAEVEGEPTFPWEQVKRELGESRRRGT